MWEDERRRQIVKAAIRGFDPSCGAQAIERATIRPRHKHFDRTPAIGDLDRFPSFDTPEKVTGALAKLPDANRYHVLLIAHRGGFLADRT